MNKQINSKNKKLYSRETARRVLEDLINRIKEANEKEEFIYKITRVVLFGSYINSNKEKIGDLDIAIYYELKDKSKPEVEQNVIRSYSRDNHISYYLRCIYGKEEVAKFIKNKHRIISIHNGNFIKHEVENGYFSYDYIYADKNKIIYELENSI